MTGTNLRFLVPTVALLVLAPLAGGAPPVDSTAPGGRDTTPARPPLKSPDYQTIGNERQLTTFSGTVLGLNDRPLSGVVVKLFNDGALVATTQTEGNGYYEIRTAYDPAEDTTALLWYSSPDPSLLPKELVLKESRASQAAGLISKCVGRATLVPGRQFRVYLFDAASRIKDLSELDCLP
jgi:hypothetical protein